MEKHVPRSTKGWMMVRLGIKMMLMIMVGASVMFFLETLGELPFFTDNGFAHLYSCSDGSVTRHESAECSETSWSVMFAFYFTVVVRGLKLSSCRTSLFVNSLANDCDNACRRLVPSAMATTRLKQYLADCWLSCLSSWESSCFRWKSTTSLACTTCVESGTRPMLRSLTPTMCL